MHLEEALLDAVGPALSQRLRRYHPTQTALRGPKAPDGAGNPGRILLLVILTAAMAAMAGPAGMEAGLSLIGRSLEITGYEVRGRSGCR